MHAGSDPRFRKRIPCRLGVGGDVYTGMVLNLSRGGLFVQTGAEVRPGDEIQVDLDLPGGVSSVGLAGEVVWKRVVATRLRAMTQGGLGLRIASAPDAYYRFLVDVLGAAPERRFRVRVLRENGVRSRTLTVTGSDETQARRNALADLGEGWVVLELEDL